jgi:hypothetical protein
MSQRNRLDDVRQNFSGPIRDVLADGLARMHRGSGAEARILAHVVDNGGDYLSSDAHCVVAAAVCDVVQARQGHPAEQRIVMLRAAFARLSASHASRLRWRRSPRA